MTFAYDSARTHAYMLLALVALQEHAYALPAPWPLLVDAVAALAEEHGRLLEPRQFEMPKVKAIPVVGSALPTAIGNQDVGSPGKIAAGAAAGEATKQLAKTDQPTPETKASDSAKPAETKKLEEALKSASSSEDNKHESSGGSPNHAGGLSNGEKAGVAVAAVLSVLLVGFLIRKYCWKKKVTEEGGDNYDDAKQ